MSHKVELSDSALIGDPQESPILDGSLLISRTETSHIFRVDRNGRRRVYKIVAPANRNSQLYQDILHKEFDILNKLSHPGIVDTLGLMENDSCGYILELEWIEGDTLDRFLSTNPDILTRRSLAIQLLDILTYIHGKGISHRDIKPTNLLVTTDGHRLKLIDFGLADSSAFTTLKFPAGTPGYMSERQMNAHTSSCSDDLYAATLVLSQLLPDRPSQLILTGRQRGKYQNASQLRLLLEKAWSRQSRLKAKLKIGGLMAGAGILVGGVCVALFSQQLDHQRDTLMLQIDSQRQAMSHTQRLADSLHHNDSLQLARLKSWKQEAEIEAANHALTVASGYKAGEDAIDKIWRAGNTLDNSYDLHVESQNLIKSFIQRYTGTLSDEECTTLESKMKARWKYNSDLWNQAHQKN